MAGRFTGYPTSQAAIVLPSGHSIAPANVRRHNRVVESLVHMRKGFVMRILAGTMGVILLSIPVHAQTVKTPVACEALSSLKLANTTIALATSVPAGTLRLSAGGPVAADLVLNDLPAFCRVSATLKPSPDSDINIEVWMPTSGWNGKFQAVGNGGWAGTIAYATPIPRSLATALRRGYATAGTDTGHTGNSGSFALGHPEKLIDFGHRAVHDMTVAAKAIIAAYYGGGPRLSYWNGCSNGGRQGLMEAQRYPPITMASWLEHRVTTGLAW